MAILSLPATSLQLPTSIVVWTGIATLLLLTWVFASWYRLRQFNGPFLAHFSHYTILRGALSGRQGDYYGEITDKYGNLARIGPRTLITCNPELVRRMNSARTKYKRSDYYRALRMNPYKDSLFSLVDTKAHDDLKARMSHGYGGKEVPTLERDIDEQISTFVDLLRHKYAAADKLAPADMASLAQYFTVDVLSKVAYGKEFGNLREDRDVYDYVESTMQLLTLLVLCAELPIFRRIFMNKTVLGMIGPSMKDETGMGKILSVAEDIVDKRFQPDFPDQMDMLGSWKRHGCTKLECESEIPFQIVAGSDTTAHAIRGTLLFLLSSPGIYRKLQEEIDAAIDSGVLSEPVKASEAKQLPYLQGVIYEGLRLTLPATLTVWKQVPPEGKQYGPRGDSSG
jgi:cytochrome P450